MTILIYDNGGKSFDRYTIIIDNYAYRMSENPLSPQGFNQYCGEVVTGVKLGKHLGKKILFESLPTDVKKAIKERME